MRKNTPEPWRVIGGRNVSTQDGLIIAIPTGDTAELLKVMAQACKDLSAIVWTDDALAVRDRLQAAITATQRKQRGDLKWT